MPVAGTLGENLARHRKIRRLSQEALAETAGVSIDTVARIERGERQTTRSDTLNKLAAALGVDPSTLLGIMPPTRQVKADVVDLRQAITADAEIPGLADFSDGRETLPPSELDASMQHAFTCYIGGRHPELLHGLPVLLADARRCVRELGDDAKAHAYSVLSGAYRLGAGTAGRFGLDDLAWTAAERALSAARQSDDPDMEIAVSTRYLAWVLVRQGRTDEAERVAVAMAERIEPRMSTHKDDPRLGVFGNLIFNASAAAVRSGRDERASDLLNVARSAAVRSGKDEVGETAIFGPRTVALQRVEHAVRLGDPETALRLAAEIPAAEGKVPAFWEAGHRIHLASAAAEMKQDKQALGYLAAARDLAPDWVRYQPLGVATMREMVDRAPRRPDENFAQLAAHYGVA